MLEIQIRPCGLTEAEFRVCDDPVFAAGGECPPQRSVREDVAESGEHVAHQRCAGRPRPHHAALEPARSPQTWCCASPSRARSWCAGCSHDVRTLREIFKDFSEDEQASIVEQLKLLGTNLDQALSHTDRNEPSERASRHGSHDGALACGRAVPALPPKLRP